MRLEDPRLRFERKFTVHEDTGCWVWHAAKGGRTARYIRGSFSVTGGRKSEPAPRASWKLYRGDIPPGMQVLHQCDNPLCVNPDHLFLGTHADNMADMKEKRRSTFGERSAKTKFSEAQVREILTSTEPNTVIAQRFGVDRATISNIRRRKHWRHIETPPVTYERMGRVQSEQTKEKMRAYWQQLPDNQRYSSHCSHGHPLAGDNLGPGRKCRACGRANRAAAYARQRTLRVRAVSDDDGEESAA